MIYLILLSVYILSTLLAFLVFLAVVGRPFGKPMKTFGKVSMVLLIYYSSIFLVCGELISPWLGRVFGPV